MRRAVVVGLLALVGAMGLGSASASAAPSDPFQYKFSFDGTGLPSGLAVAGGIAVNHANGNVLVYDAGQGTIDQFDANGAPVDFSALGSPTITGISAENLYVDNSGGPTQGYVYALAMGQPLSGNEVIYAFKPNGESLFSEPPYHFFKYPVNPNTFGGLSYVAAMAPSFDGHLWGVWTESGPMHVGQVTPSAVSTGFDKELSGARTEFGGLGAGGYGSIIADQLGNVYIPGPKSISKFDSLNDFADLGETGLPYGHYLAVDPSTNDLYERLGAKVIGVHYSEPAAIPTPLEAVNGASSDGGIDFDSSGQTLYVAEGQKVSVYHREPPSAPFGLGALTTDGIRSSRAVLHGQLSAGGAATSYHFEYGIDTSYGTSTRETSVPLSFFPVEVGGAIDGLQPGTTYHLRMVATNSAGTTYGPDRTFKTYPGPTGGGADPCPNALARKQTSAQRLPDCRAFELVSAADTGGYDVESYLAPGQTPFPGFPMATDKLLYATHSGAIPGPWKATNKGPDPYLATRGEGGWSTSYLGLPADLNPAAGSFSSVLGEADSSLDTLAFAGPGLCSPCFASGLQTGIPVRLPSGELVQGMSGSLVGSVPASAKPEGKVAKYFSADGRKLLFASKYAFEPGANDNGSDLTVYERDLSTNTTRIVSTDPSGKALTGEGISELDVSSDGSRVLVAKKLGTDPQGNEVLHPYLHIAGRPGSIDLAPGTTTGVLFAGMTSDGSKVFFTSADKLLPSDSDESADLYEADVDSSGNLSLKAITTGNDSDACIPFGCSALPIAGGGGVASGTGAIYFLSPESFGGQGTLNQPNLYLASPSGSISLVATLELENPLVLDSLFANATRQTGDFQTTPSGNYAAFTSALPLSGVHTFGFRQVFRYDAGDGQLLCASCDTTGTDEASIADEANLAPSGLSLLEDGRLFFTTRGQLVLNDANGRKDVYEYENGAPLPVSSGTGSFDSALLSASADGTDVFFFTHEALAPEEDRNGGLMRIYDAREGGGFFKLPANVPCQASDECHGPGTITPAAPDIRSSGKTTTGNVLVCAKNRVKKRGQCVKKKHAKKKHHNKKRAAKTNGKRGGRHA